MKKTKKETKSNKERYIFTFQLSSEKLNLYYDLEKNPAKAWDKISKFLKKHGFEKIKDTTYVSKSKISRITLSDVINELFEKNSWLALSNDTMKCYSINKEIDINSIIALNEDLVTEIEVLQEFPPGLDREDFSLGKGKSKRSQNNPNNQQQNQTPKKEETITIPLSKLKESIEMGIDSEITISKSDWDKIQKQTEAKKQSGIKTPNPDKQDKTTKPNKPKR